MRYWIKVSVETHHGASRRLVEALEGLGAISVSIAAIREKATDVVLPPAPRAATIGLSALYEPTVSLTKVSSLIHAIGGHGTTIRVATLSDRNWEVVSRKQFVPFAISDNLWICPSWHAPPRTDVTTLIIDPGAAFGTGYHPSTALCLDYLSRLTLAGKRILDWGCGSGILAISACKLGAASAVGVDIDHQALTVSRDNARRNGVDQKIEWHTPDALPSKDAFDVVVANILANTLIELASLLKRHTLCGGTLLLSGVTRHQSDRVMAHYGNVFTFEASYREEWALLAGRKKGTQRS